MMRAELIVRGAAADPVAKRTIASGLIPAKAIGQEMPWGDPGTAADAWAEYLHRRESTPGGRIPFASPSLVRSRVPLGLSTAHRGLGLLASALRLTLLLAFDLAHSTPSTDACFEVECMSLDERFTPIAVSFDGDPSDSALSGRAVEDGTVFPF